MLRWDDYIEYWSIRLETRRVDFSKEMKGGMENGRQSVGGDRLTKLLWRKGMCARVCVCGYVCEERVGVCVVVGQMPHDDMQRERGQGGGIIIIIITVLINEQWRVDERVLLFVVVAGGCYWCCSSRLIVDVVRVKRNVVVGYYYYCYVLGFDCCSFDCYYSFVVVVVVGNLAHCWNFVDFG